MTAPGIEVVARRFLGSPNRALSTGHRLRYRKKGSLAVDLGKNVWFDHEAGIGGGVLDLVCRENGGTHREARDWLRAELGLDDRATRRRETPASETGRHAEALAVWNAARSAKGTPVAAYLACRGITIPPPAAIRYHRTSHAAVAAVQQVDGTITGIQRVYLKTNPADTCRRRRLSLGSVLGGAVRLTPAASSLQLAESVEDGLALLQLTGLSTWAVPGAGFVQTFKPPAGTREVVLAPDHDRAGLAAIERATPALSAAGVHVRQLLPPPDWDWCEVLEIFEERAALREHDFGEDRATAERVVFAEVMRHGC